MPRLARLALASGDADADGNATWAEMVLAEVLNKQPDAAAAQGARDEAANACFEPLLRLQSSSDALTALVRSGAGRERTRRALEEKAALKKAMEVKRQYLAGQRR